MDKMMIAKLLFFFLMFPMGFLIGYVGRAAQTKSEMDRSETKMVAILIGLSAILMVAIRSLI